MSKFDKTVNRYLLEAVQPDGPITDAYGTKRWRKDGKLHREDGPAVEWDNGSEEWYINDIRHRLDGPAVTYMNQPNATKYWFVDGKKHRVDGPAVVWANGDKEWYINDIELTPAEIEEQKKKIAIAKEIQGHKNNRIDPGMLEDYL